MTTHVIILCQGQQKRLPELAIPKQMLRLPACGDTPILYRTLRQVSHLAPDADDPVGSPFKVTVVAWLPLAEQVMMDELPLLEGRNLTLGVHTLADPGNSSLKGIARFLRDPSQHADRYNRTVVLLGDVVYSWACIRAIFERHPCRFVGTEDLSRSGGELWGISWSNAADKELRWCLDEALKQHPQFEAYQPGQLRRWLWMTPLAGSRSSDPNKNTLLAELNAHGPIMLPWYHPIDTFVAGDYTRDIDIPEHVALLPDLSVRARRDDADHGVSW